MGYAFSVEILDISVEGAKLRTSSNYPLSIGDTLDLKIKWEKPITLSAEIRWINNKPPFTYIGIKFHYKEMDATDRQTFCTPLNKLCLSSLSEIFTK